ncbi:CBN-GLB-15 protein [Aphelenchoides avenae]|nr:CBN-GLB-15 protein [Aphelenchus avenae]
MDAAIDGFYAARDRYRKRRSLSRSGSNVGTPVHRRIVSRYSGRELQLDDDQCEQLKDAFSNIPDKYYVFEQMFLQLFKDDVEVAIVFGLQHIPDVELRRISTFRTHVAKFQRFMTTILDLLCKKNREDELIQIVRMVGRQHCNKQLSFTAARWLSFKNALMATFAKNEQLQDKLYNTWSILIGFLIYEIKDAYLTYIRQIRSSSLPHVFEPSHITIS